MRDATDVTWAESVVKTRLTALEATVDRLKSFDLRIATVEGAIRDLEDKAGALKRRVGGMEAAVDRRKGHGRRIED